MRCARWINTNASSIDRWVSIVQPGVSLSVKRLSERDPFECTNLGDTFLPLLWLSSSISRTLSCYFFFFPPFFMTLLIFSILSMKTKKKEDEDNDDDDERKEAISFYWFSSIVCFCVRLSLLAWLRLLLRPRPTSVKRRNRSWTKSCSPTFTTVASVRQAPMEQVCKSAFL